MSGIAYSAIMLGVLLPKLNIWMTRHNGKKQNENEAISNNIQKNVSFKSGFISMDEFKKMSKINR